MTTPPRPAHRSSLLVRFIGTGAFVGYIPWASGTFGTLVGCAVLLIPGAWQPAVLWPLSIAGFAVGVACAGIIAGEEGNRLSAVAAKTKALFQPGAHETPDPSIVVIDEIVGMWIALILVPSGWIPVLLAFIFFRAFDILKPFPAAALERIPGGWGIMLDDVIAGIYANATVQILAAIAGTFR